MKIIFENYRTAYTKFAKDIKTYCAAYTEYAEYLCHLKAEGLKEGNAAQRLESVLICAQRIPSIPEALPQKLETVTEIFLSAVHNAQVIDGTSVLYDESFSGLRNYDSDFFARLSGSVEEPDYEDTLFFRIYEWMEDNIFSFISKLIGHCDTSSEEDLEVSQANLMQYKDVTLRRLINIEHDIQSAEEKYVHQLEIINDLMQNLLDYVYALSEVFSPGTDVDAPLASEEIANLNKIYLDMYQKLISIDVKKNISEQEIEEFIASYSSYSTDEAVQIVRQYLGELAGIEEFSFEFLKIVFFQMFDVTKNTIISQEEMQEYMLKKELLDIMEELSDSYNYEDGKLNEKLDFLQDVLGYIKKGGDNWKKYYTGDKRFKEYRDVVNFLDKLSGVADLIEAGDAGIEIMTVLFTNYSRNLEFLDSIERNYCADDATKTAFANIRIRYEKELDELLEELVGEKLLDKGLSEVMKLLPGGKIIKTIETSIGLIGDITGEGDKTAAQLELLATGYDLVDMAENSFRNAVVRLQETDSSDPNYTLYMDDLRNTFDIYRTTMSDLLVKLANTVLGDERSYFYYCASTVQSMELSDYGKLDLMTMEEYLKQPIVIG